MKEIEELQPILNFYDGHITEIRCERGRLIYQSEDSNERIRYRLKNPKRFSPKRGEGVR